MVNHIPSFSFTKIHFTICAKYTKQDTPWYILAELFLLYRKAISCKVKKEACKSITFYRPLLAFLNRFPVLILILIIF
ncbi:hypothetical protein DXB35_03115 [Roseburia sp. OM03-18]|nr:hypothetical protein DXB35_03115 [Roseburia sp. OM03-18]